MNLLFAQKSKFSKWSDMFFNFSAGGTQGDTFSLCVFQEMRSLNSAICIQSQAGQIFTSLKPRWHADNGTSFTSATELFGFDPCFVFGGRFSLLTRRAQVVGLAVTQPWIHDMSACWLSLLEATLCLECRRENKRRGPWTGVAIDVCAKLTLRPGTWSPSIPVYADLSSGANPQWSIEVHTQQVLKCTKICLTFAQWRVQSLHIICSLHRLLWKRSICQRWTFAF